MSAYKKGWYAILEIQTYSKVGQFRDGVKSDLLVELCLDFLLDPLVLEGLFGGDSLLWVPLHELSDEILHLLALVGPVLGFEFVVASAHLGNDLVVIGSSEGGSTAHHDIQDDPNAPQVALLIVVALQHFRSDIVGSAVDLVHGMVVLVVGVRGAEINDLDCSFLFCVNQNVLRLQISVGHILSVAVADGLKDLFGDNSRLKLAKFLSSSDLVEQLDAVAEFSYKEDAAFIFVDLIKPHNVGVVQILENINFVLEPDALLLAHVELVDDLHCPHLLGRLLLALLYPAKGT